MLFVSWAYPAGLPGGGNGRWWMRTIDRGRSIMSGALICWKCGASLDELPLPLARLSECPSCNAYLHVCRMCEFYDASVSRSCREPVAEEVTEKERANFCGYFRAKPDAFNPGDETATQAARDELQALFGKQSEAETNPLADELKAHRDKKQSEADVARNKLNQLFDLNDKEPD